MTKTAKPLAVLLAATMFVSLWVPVLFVPAPAYAAGQLA